MLKFYGDLHCDTLWRCFTKQTDLSDPRLQVRPHRLFHHLQTYAIFIPDAVHEKKAYFDMVYAYGQEIFSRVPEMVQCKHAREIVPAFSAGKTPYLISVEGGGFFGDNPRENRSIARDLREKGVAFLSLCYSGGNHLAGGVQNAERGLSPAGADAARLLYEYGIGVDLSHLNERSADALLELLPGGVLATHSNCRALAANPRNLTNDQIRAVAEKKGLIGVNFFPPFLRDEREADSGDVLLHIRYLESLGAGASIAFGSDFDGIDTTPADLRHVRDLPRLLRKVPAAYRYGNMKRYLDQNFK